jgi:hypothetical protein
VKRTLLTIGAATALYAAMLFRPQLLFAQSVRAGNVVLHARQPLPSQTMAIAASVLQRVRRSPLYRERDTYDVFFCDTPALFAFFAGSSHNAGAIADVYLSQNVFLRPSRIERDRLIGPSGREATGDRTLTYFIAHEIAHVMTVRGEGRLGYARLHTWQREGYADYVGKAGAFDFGAVLRDFKANAQPLDPARSGLYLRYHLLVAELLDARGMAPAALLAHPIDAAPIESELQKR